MAVVAVVAVGCGGKGSPEAEAEAPASVGEPTTAPEGSSPPAGCRPTGGGPHWIDEGARLEVALSCASGRALPAGTTLAPLPRGAQFDAATGRLRWTPELDQAAVWTLSVIAGPDDAGALVIGVADAFWDPANVPVLDPSAYPQEHGVPALFIEYAGVPEKDLPIPARVTYRGRTWSETAFKLQGETSLTYPKNSYGLRFPSDEPFEDPEKAFVGRTKIRLTTTFDDNSYVRQRLAYTLWSWMDPKQVQVGIYSVVVYLNGHYAGLYELSDDVDKGLLQLSGLNKDGNLYKAVDNNANFQPFLFYTPLPPASPLKSTPHDGYRKKEGLPPQGMPGDFDDLDGFLSWLYGADPFAFRTGFSNRADPTEFENSWIFVTALIASDNLHKNYYLFHDPAGGRWRYIPWDLNGTLGQAWHTGRELPRVPAFSFDNGLFVRFTSDPTIRLPMEVRYGRLLRNQWSLSRVLAAFDAMSAEVRGAALRDERRWGDAYRTFSLWARRTDFLDHEGEVAYVRDWLIRQWALLSEQYP